MKRVSRVWGKRFRRGWIIWKPSLLNELRLSDYVQFGEVTVPTHELKAVLNNGIQTQDCLIRVNEGLQVEEVQRYRLPSSADARVKQIAHRLIDKRNIYLIKDGRKKTDGVGVILQIKPKKYG